MKLRIVVSLLFVIFSITPAGAALITFSGMSGSPGDVSFDTPLLALGVTMTISGGTAEVQSPVGAPIVISNPALTVNTTGNNPADPAQLRINFIGGALNDTISLAVWDSNVDVVRVLVQSFTAGNAPIETVTLTNLDDAAVLAFTAAGTAAYIIVSDIGGDGHVLDSISFTSAAIPEPSTFVMFGTAVLALVFVRRRHRL